MIEIVTIVAGRLSRVPLFSLAAGDDVQRIDRPLSTPLSGATRGSAARLLCMPGHWSWFVFRSDTSHDLVWSF
jgi:hypothetical protein